MYCKKKGYRFRLKIIILSQFIISLARATTGIGSFRPKRAVNWPKYAFTSKLTPHLYKYRD